MAETQRLTMWGWFARAFAGGFGAMFGVMTALTAACLLGYTIVAAGAVALSSFGTVTLPVAANGSATVPWVNTTAQCVTPTAPTQAYQSPTQAYQSPTQAHQSPVYEARAQQGATYPSYSTQSPADFLQGTVPQPIASGPTIESEAAGVQPATNPK